MLIGSNKFLVKLALNCIYIANFISIVLIAVYTVALIAVLIVAFIVASPTYLLRFNAYSRAISTDVNLCECKFIDENWGDYTNITLNILLFYSLHIKATHLQTSSPSLLPMNNYTMPLKTKVQHNE